MPSFPSLSANGFGVDFAGAFGVDEAAAGFGVAVVVVAGALVIREDEGVFGSAEDLCFRELESRACSERRSQ